MKIKVEVLKKKNNILMKIFFFSSCDELDELKKSISNLMGEVKELKKEINKLKNDK